MKTARTDQRARTILAIDVGGSHVKVMTSEDRIKREFESGSDLTAKQMVRRVKTLTKDWSYDVISIGYPGPVAGNRPLREPFNLGEGWKGFDFQKAFGKPTKVVNDALMQAFGGYKGGRMLFLGLGTGLGSAMIADGELEPMELGHLPYRKGKTYEDYVGEAGRERRGDSKWRKHVTDVVKQLTAALEPDEVLIGGGNVEHLDKLPPKSRRGDNADAFEGGFRLWEKEWRQRGAKRRDSMANRFKIGDHVSWNSEAGRVSGTITSVHTGDFDYKGHTRRASEDDPQYEIKSDKTDHVAAHKGGALEHVRR